MLLILKIAERFYRVAAVEACSKDWKTEREGSIKEQLPACRISQKIHQGRLAKNRLLCQSPPLR